MCEDELQFRPVTTLTTLLLNYIFNYLSHYLSNFAGDLEMISFKTYFFFFFFFFFFFKVRTKTQFNRQSALIPITYIHHNRDS